MTSKRKIVCPSCQAGLKIAADLAAEKRVRCPKCLEAFPQSAFADWVPRARRVAVGAGPAQLVEEQPLLEEYEQAPEFPEEEDQKKLWGLNRPLALGLAIGGAVFVIGVAVTLAILRPWESKKPQFVAPTTTRPTTPARNARARRPGMDAATAPKEGSKATAPEPPMGEELPPPAGKESAEAVPMQVMAGKNIYDSLDCSRCHTIGTTSAGGFRKEPRGPSLARVGADTNHTVEWLSQQIRDPRSHRPGSRMPPYGEDKLSRENLRSLAEYLASLK
jgi:predicted Zn finger-like uncharacterized protein